MRADIQHGNGNPFYVQGVVNGLVIKLRMPAPHAGVLAVSDMVGRRTAAAARRGAGLDALVGAGEHYRQFTAHRMAQRADLLGINFALLLQESYPALGGDDDEKPVVIAGRFDGVNRELIGHERPVVAVVSGLRRVDGTPVGGRVAAPGFLHLAAAPVNRKGRVSVIGAVFDTVNRRPLPPTVHLNQRGQLAFFPGLRGKSVERGHRRLLALERSDGVSQIAIRYALVGPLAYDLDFERFFCRVVSGPQVFDVPGNLPILQRREGIGGVKRSG